LRLEARLLALAAPINLASENLRSGLVLLNLAFQSDDGFGSGVVLFAIGAGDIAERGLVDGRAEIGERDFSVGKVKASRAIETSLVAQEIFSSLARMIDQLQGLNDVAQNGSVLSEGGAGDEENK